MWLTRIGAVAELSDAIDRNLIAYLARYTGLDLKDMDATPISRLKRIADGVSEIIEQENKPSKD